MFEKPTVNDFLGQLYMQRDAAVHELQGEVNAIGAEMARRGLLNSGATVRRTLGALEKAIETATSHILSELRRAIQETEIDPKQLRDLTIPRLNETRLALISVVDPETLKRRIGSSGATAEIERRVDGLSDKIEFLVRQFDVGFDRSAASTAAPVVNTITAENIIGGIQQGVTHSSQQNFVEVDFRKIQEAVGNLENALEGESVPPEVIDEIKNDLDTIKAQLRKPRPSIAIIREAARTIRNIGEGVIGGMLTPLAIQAINALVGAVN